MNARPAASALAAALALLAGGCAGDAPPTPEAPEPAESPAPAEAPAEPDAAPDAPAFPAAPPAAPEPVDPEQVVAKVGTSAITEGEVLERLAEIVSSQMRGRTLPPEQMQGLRASMGSQVLEELIDERLLDDAAAAAGIAFTDEEYRVELEEQIETWLAFEGRSEAEFAMQVEAGEGRTFQQFLEETAEDEDFRRGVRHTRWLVAEYPERTAVSDEEVREAYAEQLEEVWSRPARVRASHILFELPADPAEATAKREEAERVLALVRAEGADFAALAREHSEGPSGPDGGELGFFPREGAMVEPFAAAAFELQAGDVSDLVETQFGLHVIRVAEREEARVVPLEEAASAIRRQLESVRVAELRPERLEEMRATAEIEYL